jgi:hypothetical protein
MESKLKHNKKRNTAFLYECLVRELTKSMLEKKNDRRNSIILILKEYFSQETALCEELKVYRQFESDSIEENLADKLINDAKIKYSSIDKKDIFNEQSSLINSINKKLGFSVYDNYVPNYKLLATLSQIFNDKLTIKEKILLEENIKKVISIKEKTKQEKMLENIDNLTYSTFVRRFNEQYNEKLLKEQKELLTKYVKSNTDNSIELKVYLNEEIYRLKEQTKKLSTTKEMIEDKEMSKKLENVNEFLNNFKNQQFNQESLAKILKIQQLVHEANLND